MPGDGLCTDEGEVPWLPLWESEQNAVSDLSGGNKMMMVMMMAMMMMMMMMVVLMLLPSGGAQGITSSCCTRNGALRMQKLITPLVGGAHCIKGSLLFSSEWERSLAWHA